MANDREKQIAAIKKTKQSEQEIARANFRKTWNSAYGDRPATIVAEKDREKEKRLNG